MLAQDSGILKVNTRVCESNCCLADLSLSDWKTEIRRKQDHKKWNERLIRTKESIASLEVALGGIPSGPPATEVTPRVAVHLTAEKLTQDDSLPVPPRRRYTKDTAIVDTGASGIFCMPGSLVKNINKEASKINARTASGEPCESSATCDLDKPEIPPHIPVNGHIMPTFTHNLVGIGTFCDKDCSVTYAKKDVIIYDLAGNPIVEGWREPPTSGLWRMSLVPEGEAIKTRPGAKTISLETFSAYDLPLVEALMKFLHAAPGYPVKDTWLKAIKAGNYKS